VSQDTLQLAKVSKLLLAFDRGDLAKYKGKSLDEIELAENDVECDSDSGCEDEATTKHNKTHRHDDVIDFENAAKTCRHGNEAALSQALAKQSKPASVTDTDEQSSISTSTTAMRSSGSGAKTSTGQQLDEEVSSMSDTDSETEDQSSASHRADNMATAMRASGSGASELSGVNRCKYSGVFRM